VGRRERRRKDVHGCVEVASPDRSAACACGFGFEVDDLAVGEALDVPFVLCCTIGSLQVVILVVRTVSRE
jgi:hypothetical protein